MRLRYFLKSKIHRATVTDADVEYEGSVSIDKDLMDAAGLLESEFVHIWNVTNGHRLKTYVMEGRAGSGEVVINGAAAHRMKKGDLVIISSFHFLSDEENVHAKPIKVFVDDKNKIKFIS